MVTIRIVITYAMGSLLPDSSSRTGPRFSFNFILLSRRMENTDAESVDAMTEARRMQPRSEAVAEPTMLLDEK
jgi:hypothetical protein